MKNISGALKLLLCLSVTGWWILAAPNQKKLKCSSELSLPVENAMQEIVTAVNAVITFGCWCSSTGWIWRKGNIYYPHKTSPLSAAPENSTQGCRQVSAACGCRPEERELLLAACFTENKLLPSDSPAEPRAVFASCNVSERWSWAAKWCSEWLLHRLLLANLHYALRFYFLPLLCQVCRKFTVSIISTSFTWHLLCEIYESIGSNQSCSFWPSKLQTHQLWSIIFKLPVKI